MSRILVPNNVLILGDGFGRELPPTSSGPLETNGIPLPVQEKISMLCDLHTPKGGKNENTSGN